MKLALVVPLMVALLVSSVYAEDKKLTELESRLASAMNQAEMNAASGEIAAHLDKELFKKELEIVKVLDEDSARLFKRASKLWRDYRMAQISFEEALHRGGSIEPLIRNDAFSRITQERLFALSALTLPE
jgi:uncharacterized protein YecT (DUF1311 family)